MQTNINITVSMTGNRKTSAHFASIMLLRRPKRQGNWKQKECVSEARVCQSSCIPAWQAQASVGLWAGVCSWGYHVLLALHSTLFLYQFQSVCVCVCVFVLSGGGVRIEGSRWGWGLQQSKNREEDSSQEETPREGFWLNWFCRSTLSSSLSLSLSLSLGGSPPSSLQTPSCLITNLFCCTLSAFIIKCTSVLCNHIQAKLFYLI